MLKLPLVALSGVALLATITPALSCWDDDEKVAVRRGYVASYTTPVRYGYYGYNPGYYGYYGYGGLGLGYAAYRRYGYRDDLRDRIADRPRVDQRIGGGRIGMGGMGGGRIGGGGLGGRGGGRR